MAVQICPLQPMYKDLQKRKDWFNKRRQDCMNFLRQFKKDKSCLECGWNEHTDILQFHHKDPNQKEIGFAKGSIGNYSIKRILAEIAKCDLLCPNCHFWLHYQEKAKLS